MAASDSDLSDIVNPGNSDTRIAQELRNVVVETFRAQDFENLTIKRVRAAVTKRLDLPEDFLKQNKKWNDRSREIVKATVEEQEKAQLQSDPAQGSAKENVSTRPESASSARSKRKSPENTAGPKKRRKVSSSPKASSPELAQRGNRSAESQDESKNEKWNSPAVQTKVERQGAAAGKLEPSAAAMTSDSELSELIDDSPPPKTSRKKRDPTPKSAKVSAASSAKSKSAKTKSKTPSELTPDEDEIRKLQGWLVKCGIRKVWGRELAKCDTPKEKIAHLRHMLKDAGMEGRFSEEKAKRIREERELKADLDAIKEGEERWGLAKDEPGRRLPKGLQEIEGLGDDEESD